MTGMYDRRVFNPVTNDQVREYKLTVAEVAAMLRVSKMSIYRATAAGELRSYRVGKQIRIPSSAVREYLARGCAA